MPFGSSSGGPVPVSPFLSIADPCGAAQGRPTVFGCDDTNPRKLANNGFSNSGYLERIHIALLDGGSVFDVDMPNPGTFNSADGATFNLLTGLPAGEVITATLSQQVALPGNPPLDDVWGYLSISLTGITSQGGNGLRDSITIIADTDPIPLPAALRMLMGAAGGLASPCKRRAL